MDSSSCRFKQINPVFPSRPETRSCIPFVF